MANRIPTVLNPAGYHEILQAADKLVSNGGISTTTLEASGQVTFTNNVDLNNVTAQTLSTTGNIVVDNNTGDLINIVLDTSGNVTLSGVLEASSMQLSQTVLIDGILDEDDLISNSATKLATQQSIKAYVDAVDLTINLAADNGNSDVMVTGETLTFTGTADEIVTTITDNQITFSQPEDVTIGNNLTVTTDLLTPRFTLSGYAVTSILNEGDLVSDSALALPTQTSVKTYVDSFPTATTSAKGFMSGQDKTKLDGIETNATEDQTGAEIKALYEAEADTNAFDDAARDKLANIEANATQDQTGAEIKALYEVEPNAFTDTDRVYIDGLPAELNLKADLVGGLIPDSQIPPIAVTEYLGVVPDDTAMLALNGQNGDWCVRSDEGKVFVITGDPTTIAGWQALVYPTPPATNITWDPAASIVGSSTGTGATLTAAVSGGNAGLLTGADKAILDALNAAPTTITFAGQLGTDAVVNTGETLTINGTVNQTTVTTDETADSLTVALTNDVTIGGTMSATTLSGTIDGGVYAS